MKEGSWQGKRKLFEAINHYNDQVPGEEKVENRLGAVGGTDSLIWPQEAAVCSSFSPKLLHVCIIEANS